MSALRRLIAPGRGEPRLDEDGADEAHDAQGFRQRVHARLTESRRRWRAPPAPRSRRRWKSASSDSCPRPARAVARGSTRRAAMRTTSCDVARPGVHARAFGIRHAEKSAQVRAAASPRLRARRARFPLRRRAHRDARGGARREPGAEQPARRDFVAGRRPTRSACRSPSACRSRGSPRSRVPPSQRAEAGASACTPTSGRRCRIRFHASHRRGDVLRCHERSLRRTRCRSIVGFRPRRAKGRANSARARLDERIAIPDARPTAGRIGVETRTIGQCRATRGQDGASACGKVRLVAALAASSGASRPSMRRRGAKEDARRNRRHHGQDVQRKLLLRRRRDRRHRRIRGDRVTVIARRAAAGRPRRSTSSASGSPRR